MSRSFFLLIWSRNSDAPAFKTRCSYGVYYKNTLFRETVFFEDFWDYFWSFVAGRLTFVALETGLKIDAATSNATAKPIGLGFERPIRGPMRFRIGRPSSGAERARATNSSVPAAERPRDAKSSAPAWPKWARAAQSSARAWQKQSRAANFECLSEARGARAANCERPSEAERAPAVNSSALPRFPTSSPLGLVRRKPSQSFCGNLKFRYV